MSLFINKLSRRLSNKDRIGTLQYMSPEMYILSHKTLRQELGKKQTNNVNSFKNTFNREQTTISYCCLR